ncbi:hypothetical protein [Bradyrhizobium canariense]|uniref:Uncharacterized protein n=1 Tax=Bradyrhizobium canariense TaxID=255045 RepID=A0A1H2A1H5_9BRAD|nr:hypothetical protein [Bradyrhizobium canariense]SDT39861.1 hypothetical protein SAMN05444158_5826 [Bradyrhizobium canariense]
MSTFVQFPIQLSKSMTVIASEAKQSRAEHRGKVLDCFVASLLAMTHYGAHARILAALTARVVMQSAPRKWRAQGKPGARCTRSLVRKVLEAHECRHHRFTGTPGLPCAMVLTVYSALSPVIGLSCHRRRCDAKRHHLRDAQASSTDLTPASGRQDHTASPSALSAGRLRAEARPTLPRPSHSIPRS